MARILAARADALLLVAMLLAASRSAAHFQPQH
jgi:cobalamin synthase